MSTDPRLFLDADFSAGARLPLEKDQAHYLLTVMRRKAGDRVRVFNGRHGEWRAVIAEASRKTATLEIGEQTRAQAGTPDLALYFAPVKKARTDFIVEKATELGARSITPVMTARTIADRVRTDRLEAIAREAAEQTERLDLPAIGEPVSLTQLIKFWDPERRLVFCDEAGDEDDAPWGGQTGRARPMAEALAAFVAPPTPALPSRGGRDAESASLDRPGGGELNRSQDSSERRDAPPSPSGGEAAKADPGDRATGRTGGGRPQKWAILIGPEGGFAPEERGLLRSAAFVVPVTLGPRILRADTAVAASMSVFQAILGDW
ncbi:MAG: RsmE family RNA methyltransferase [Oceanicaulis sp.]